MRMYARIALSLAFIFNTLASSVGYAEPFVTGSYVYEYNSGPDPKTPMGREVIDILADQPYYRYLSDELMDEQKFRYIFGLMMTRTYFEPNSTKIFFIGQDATHIAEAAKQPGTSGFGGRVQDIANYFGVDQGVATSNAFLSTIKGQFGAFGHIYLKVDADGKPESFTTGKYIDNELWMIANDPASEIRIQRERFWEWMLKNNPESLRMMVMFGDAAKHAFAEFLIARGAEVPTNTTPDELSRIRVPETILVNAGGNAEFAVPVDKKGNDIYQIIATEAGEGRLDYSNPEHQEKAVALVKANQARAMELMVFTDGGINKSGVMNAAQLGGYDFSKIKINGKFTNSLKGLKLSDGHIIDVDIAFTESPHPTSLSQMTPPAAAASLKKTFAKLEYLKNKGWKIEPDYNDDGTLRVNQWHEGLDYKYGRADIRQGFFEFGAPSDRRANSSSAIRFNPQAIVIGARVRPNISKSVIANVAQGKPSHMPNPNDAWSGRPKNIEQRYDFDRGPGQSVAKDLMEALNASKDDIFALKGGYQKTTDRNGNDTSFDTYGIEAYYAKTVAETGFFGMHRGDFQTAKVVIMADPHGIDDWNTARALTGARGQYLNGLMNDLGYGKDYLIIKTAPVGMTGASVEDWEHVRKHTESYREAAMKHALQNKNVEFVMADGEIAQAEIARILERMGRTDIKVINIYRGGMDPASGILEAGNEVKELFPKEFKRARITGKMHDIPRSHLPWWARIWEGTSGDLVVEATGRDAGKVKVVVTPDWVVAQQLKPTEREVASAKAMRMKMIGAGIKVGSETFPEYFARVMRNVKVRASNIREKFSGALEALGLVKTTKTAAVVGLGSAYQCKQFYMKKTP